MTGSCPSGVTSAAPPTDPAVAQALFVDPCGQLDFLDTHYLQAFLTDGGSKLKLVVGREGSGKTFMLQQLLTKARTRGYLTRLLSASDFPLHSFHQLYGQVVTSIDPWSLARRYAQAVVRFLGYSYRGQPDKQTFMEWAISQGRDGSLVRREVMDRLMADLLHDRDLDRSFASALTAMTAHDLGVEPKTAEDCQVLSDWLTGQPVRAKDRHRLQLRKPVDRYTARLMLRSFLHFLPKANYLGVVVAIDDFDCVAVPRLGVESPKYTKTRRDDLYESLRQIIDEVDTLPGLMLVIAGRRDMLDDLLRGFRSYPALWMRLQNEIASDRCNRFSDTIDLDALWRQAGPKSLATLGEAIILQAGKDAAATLPAEGLQRIADTGAISPVKRTVNAVLEQLRR